MVTELTATDLDVTGAVPPGLAGRYIRTGPNPFAAEADTSHWFAGDGMVHGVDLHGGRPRWYRNRWVRSPEVSAHLGESDVPHEVGEWYPGSGNTNVFAHAGRVLAVTEGSLPYELTGVLDTVATRNFGGPPWWHQRSPQVRPEHGRDARDELRLRQPRAALPRDLVIIDAHDFVRPVATVHLPARVPQGFHGNWIPDTALV